MDYLPAKLNGTNALFKIRNLVNSSNIKNHIFHYI